jgi:hypothetical protein
MLCRCGKVWLRSSGYDAKDYNLKVGANAFAEPSFVIALRYVGDGEHYSQNKCQLSLLQSEPYQLS